jgi:hypothetical protein
MNNPIVISQTQDEKEHLTLKIDSPTSKSTSGDSKSKAYIWADRKPMVQLTLDGPIIMIAPHKKGKRAFKKTYFQIRSLG